MVLTSLKIGMIKHRSKIKSKWLRKLKTKLFLLKEYHLQIRTRNWLTRNRGKKKRNWYRNKNKSADNSNILSTGRVVSSQASKKGGQKTKGPSPQAVSHRMTKWPNLYRTLPAENVSSANLTKACSTNHLLLAHDEKQSAPRSNAK